MGKAWKYFSEEERRAGRAAQAAAWKATNPDKVKAYRTALIATNPDKVKAYRTAWKAANPEKVKAQKTAWYARRQGRIRDEAETEEFFQLCITASEIFKQQPHDNTTRTIIRDHTHQRLRQPHRRRHLRTGARRERYLVRGRRRTAGRRPCPLPGGNAQKGGVNESPTSPKKDIKPPPQHP